MDEQILFMSPSDVKIAVSPHNLVGVLLDYGHPSLGLAPGVRLAFELTPTEARDFAAKLLDKAAEAEGSPSRH
ncbi:hypothetical protein HFO06_05475 [Rhizobium leguminosarum]|uniref:hypothetical protein n=1 Tax=Rhizobium leguminosarum TaxID=384 RepID=UPI001C981B41|nr:hypothetical protein [Rhizobium leguminosarum]MBY5762558.1 hypothetical protein [Rhizobium leguminosarum]